MAVCGLLGRAFDELDGREDVDDELGVENRVEPGLRVTVVTETLALPLTWRPCGLRAATTATTPATTPTVRRTTPINCALRRPGGGGKA